MAIPRRVTRLIVVAIVLGGLLHLLFASSISGSVIRPFIHHTTPDTEAHNAAAHDAPPADTQYAVDDVVTEPDSSAFELSAPEREELQKQAHEEVTAEEKAELKDKQEGSLEHKLYAAVFSAFYDQRPQRLDIPKFNKYGKQGRLDEGKLKKHPLTAARLREFLQIEPADVKKMTELHGNLLGELDRLLNEFGDLSKIYRGNGVAIVAGGRFMPIATNSLRMLRRTGCTLPVEIFLANKEEYEPQLCEDVFPSLGAECKVLPDVLGKAALRNFPLKGYQFKVLSALASSFENVLLLDADNIAIKDPTTVFDSEVFQKYGYILWPDYWERSTHPDFFTIAGTKLGGIREERLLEMEAAAKKEQDKNERKEREEREKKERKEREQKEKDDKKDKRDISDEEALKKAEEELATGKQAGIDGVEGDKLSEGGRSYEKKEKDSDEGAVLADRMGALPNPSTESGQVFVNKSAKFKALLLATYYNLNGPRYYYPLFSQGMMGEGDKETFLAAATVLGEPVYQVPRHVQAIGYWYKDSFHGTAMLQFDAVKTYELYAKAKAGEIEESQRSKMVEKEGMFMHTNFPKMNPKELFAKTLLKNDEGEKFRAFGSQSGLNGFLPSRDLELEMWQEAEWMTCSEIQYANWKDIDRENLCKQVAEHVDFMLSTTWK